MSKATAWPLALLAILFTVGSARADGGPMPYVGELIQFGQDVEVNFGIPETHINYGLSMQRVNQAGDVLYLFTDQVFSADDALGVAVYNDAFGNPHDFYQFELIDECVPPDIYEYKFGFEDFPDQFTVEDTGDPCLGNPAGPTDGGSSDEGCSVSGVGADATAGALGILMLGIGLAGLFVSRRRSRV